ncbi:pantoate--beta-alanine ligase [Corynebacterium pseudodiphtheriticum]|uniref:pantoate--beta-alanine ligase n=1 Tax=Corynebacterium pseudodiphtheriticum TaxID=37637 RepID=UPI00234DE0F2|nr:pantoate--beta-alanine ligase [Corynebacterium pseudodiphtheriticum]MDC7068266.1 pantoate--beta-alanine ligase [Corynebacterium pseudodiphtheriticum]MDC7084331.1 pantoate--beta-alanine ligase [Corynebacterium pseudodiphtheriticum]MDC7086108.1 pantoate--beta-alanine ligase [Corynebacterium pseudodiphtheriticum]MDK4274520.1 pantoate--beta-alanine ligase [Corynebacterium pseudodiphtheriticum]MDK4327947.1 pantoate--beta-alanine ligase [Corynebacterium pseudodiphtheriticum]
MSFAFGQATHFHLADIARFSRVMQKTGKSLHLVVLGQDIHAGHRMLLRTAQQLGVVVAAVELPHGDAAPGAKAHETNQGAPSRQLNPELMDVLREAGVDAVVPYTREPGEKNSLWPQGLRTQIIPPEGLEDSAALAEALTVHLSLLHAVGPDSIIAGEKDYEFLLRLQQAITDLHLAVKVQGVPTVRMPDGLAMSLRNTEIPVEHREKAVALSAALTAGAHVAERGAQVVLETAQDVLDAAGVQPDYLELRARDFGPAPQEGDARLLVAATFGGVRLIDNVGVPVGIGFRNLDGDN